MPNHVTNVLEVTGPAESVEKFRVTVSTENPVLMKHLEDERDACIKISKSVLEKDPKNIGAQIDLSSTNKPIENSVLNLNGTVPMPIPVACTTSPAQNAEEENQQAENLKLYGAGNWYDWTCKFWGTKWGAYRIQGMIKITRGLRYTFDTAWSIPHLWLLTTSEMFSDLTFIDSWHDEGGPTGIDTYQSGYLKSAVVRTEHEWMMDWNEGYRNEYNAIVTGPYRILKKKYLIDRADIEHSSLQEALIKRVKPLDLPLMVGLELDDPIQEILENRLKGDSHAKQRGHRKIPVAGR